MARTKIFVSYSHQDGGWLDRFKQHVASLERIGLIDVWSDTRIPAGAAWEKEIELALTASKVAVLLVSPAFLASDYIWKYEIPRIIAHSAQGMDSLPLIIRPCAWQLDEFLNRLQVRPKEGRALSLGTDSQIDLDLASFAYELADQVGRSPAAMAASESSAGLHAEIPEEVDIRGKWAGYYNQTRPVQLSIRQIEGNRFSGRMEYPNEKTVTVVEGTIHLKWSPSDPLWAQISASGVNDSGRAVSFRETRYERKGICTISFEGEYRAVFWANVMAGAWFSGERRFGALTLNRV